MYLLPYKEFVLQSDLSINVIYERFHKNVQMKYLLAPNKTVSTSFQGGILEDGLHVEKIIEYRNSFNPEAIVKLEQHSEGTIVKVTLRMARFVNIFMVMWITMVLFAFFVILFSDISRGQFSGFTLIPLVMIAFAYAIAIGGFNFEVDDLQNFIERLLTSKLNN